MATAPPTVSVEATKRLFGSFAGTRVEELSASVDVDDSLKGAVAVSAESVVSADATVAGQLLLLLR